MSDGQTIKKAHKDDFLKTGDIKTNQPHSKQNSIQKYKIKMVIKNLKKMKNSNTKKKIPPLTAGSNSLKYLNLYIYYLHFNKNYIVK